jgi:gliding motility-associated-like protein
VPILSLGADTAVCNGNTLILNAPAGFATYQWEAGTTVIGTGTQVQLIIMANQQITLSATSTEGCVASDTLEALMKQAPPVSLGNDSSFCSDKTLILNAGAGYSQYLWSTGNNGNTITVNLPGNYWVAATAINGCIARDTMTITDVYPIPHVNLGEDFGICFNENRRLDPGNFIVYLWQDNSTSRYFVAKSLGTYYVTVTDQHNCMASDTVKLKTIFPVPVNFLQGKDSICSYEKISLSSSTSFKSYVWSSGSIQSSIIITDPGRYTLTATDINGCKGKDTLDVYAKDCMLGFFAPNAFTPNNDGANDVFRPLIFGPVESYTLLMYNRYGQLLFSSTNPLTGWDGRFQSELQGTGGYVWICRYKLSGQSPKIEKGNVLLVK